MSDTEAKPSANMFTDKPLAGQHAVVTGGSRGIGATVSEDLARMGAKISLTARNPDTLDTHAETLRKAHGNQVFTKAGDMSKEGDIVAAFEGAVDALGPVDILIANAGIGKSAPFHRMELDFWQAIIDLNLTGTFLCCKQVSPAMRQRGYGRIVNIASTVGLRGYPYIAAYSASKAGLSALGQGLQAEFAGSPITISVLLPGYIETDINRGVRTALMTDTDTGVAAMVAAIEKESAWTPVPAWPWRPIAVTLRYLPSAITRRMV